MHALDWFLCWVVRLPGVSWMETENQRQETPRHVLLMTCPCLSLILIMYNAYICAEFHLSGQIWACACSGMDLDFIGSDALVVVLATVADVRSIRCLLCRPMLAKVLRGIRLGVCVSVFGKRAIYEWNYLDRPGVLEIGGALKIPTGQRVGNVLIEKHCAAGWRLWVVEWPTCVSGCAHTTHITWSAPLFCVFRPQHEAAKFEEFRIPCFSCGRKLNCHIYSYLNIIYSNNIYSWSRIGILCYNFMTFCGRKRTTYVFEFCGFCEKKVVSF